MQRDEILQKAISAIDELQRRLAAEESKARQPIAIVGAGCRFPGRVRDLDSYWDFLASGRSACEPLPDGRWLDASHYDEDVDAPGKLNCLRAGWLDDALEFDPHFFGISERETASMDPQQRVLLQIAWEALESAGLAPESLRHSKSGVFVGVMNNDYGRTFVTPDDLRGIDAYYFTGNSFSFASGRLSYALGLRGPSVSLDAACASSLIAVHLACQSLRLGECNLALAGGVSLILGPQLGVVLSKARVLAPDGRSKVFDASANGIGRGEGAGIVVLKRLDDALRDRDPILGVIRGSAINHGGASLGITVPSGPAQEELIRAALRDASLQPEDVDYVEAHGTGTAIGDPIEATAIGNVLGGAGRGRPLWLGSVKANFGHLDSAAGMAGLMKVLAAMRADRIPPQVGFDAPNPAIEWDQLHLRVPSDPMAWPSRRHGEKIAGVSAFGMSGMNAHLLLTQPPETEAHPHDTSENAVIPHVLPISAKTAHAATQLGRRYLERLRTTAPSDISAFCRTAVLGRFAKEFRMVVVGSNGAELDAALEKRLQSPPTRARGDVPITFVFSGQGSQWQAMAKPLYEGFEVFREAVAECARHLDPAIGKSVVDLLVAENSEAHLERTRYAQPAIFALQVGLVALWKSFGVVPAQVIGHSVGEIAAAHCAGALDLESACRLVVLRAHQMDESTGEGRMLLVRARQEVASDLLVGLECDIAAINSDAAVVVSGPKSAIDELRQRASRREIAVRDLGVDYAFHSRVMEPHAEALAARLSWLRPADTVVPMISTVTGTPVEGSRLGAAYWAENMRRPVRFAEAVRQAVTSPAVVLELGPHAVLSTDLRDTFGSGDYAVFASLQRHRPGATIFLSTLSDLFERGVASKLPCVRPEGKKVSLPSYPWQNQTYRPLYEPLAKSSTPAPRIRESSLLGERIEVAVESEVIAWSTSFDATRLPWVREHRVNGQTLLPGTAMLEMMTAAAHEGHEVAELADVRFHEGLVVPDSGARSVQTTLNRTSGELAIWSRIAGATGEWTRHVTARVHVPNLRYERLFLAIDDLEDAAIPKIRERCDRHRSGTAHLERMASMGLEYGTMFAGVEELWIGQREALARIDGSAATSRSGRRPHPGVVDACLQVAAAALDASDDPMLPHRVGRFAWREPGVVAWCHATIHEQERDLARGDVVLYDEAGRVLGEALDLELRRARRAASQVRLLTERWKRVELPRHESLAASRWVVTTDDPDALRPLVELLKRRGADVRVVTSDLENLRDCDGLVFALDLAGKEPERTLAALLKTTQLALNAGGLEKLVVVTRGVFTLQSAAPNWRSAGLHGFLRVLEHEVSRCSISAVDLDPDRSLEDQAPRVQALFEKDVHESTVAIRSGQLWCNRVVEAHVQDADLAPFPEVVARAEIRPDRPVLVSGGRGGLGLAIAEFLAARGAKHLVLVGRSAPDAWVRATVEKLERQGVSVQLPELDLSDRDAVRAMLDDVTRSGRSIGGIVHAAGVLDDGLVAELDESRLRRVWQPKVGGFEHLLEEAGAVDFIWLFSSATSLLGNAGQGNYGAANAVLDAVAHHLARRGFHARSFNWGAWREVGMLALDPSAADNLFRKGLTGMSNAEALDALTRALDTTLPQVGILKLEADRYATAHPERARSPRLQALFGDVDVQTKQGGMVREELRALPPARRPAKLRKSIAAILETVLRRRDAIPTDRSFDQLGVDSLMALEIKNRIESELTLSLSVGSLWSYPTVERLSEHLLQQLDFEGAEDRRHASTASNTNVPGVSALLSRLRTEVQPS